jgi:hypothetical protein
MEYSCCAEETPESWTMADKQSRASIRSEYYTFSVRVGDKWCVCCLLDVIHSATIHSRSIATYDAKFFTATEWSPTRSAAND